MKNKLKNQKGVTLIALVITIIVLIILASVTIGTLLGENGTVENSVQITENTVKEQIIQSAKIDISAKELEQNRVLNQEELEKILEKYGTINYTSENKITGITTKEGYSIDILDIYDKEL